MTAAERTTLRAACETAIARAAGRQAQPVVEMLPAAMVLWLLEQADELESMQRIIEGAE